jgi:hypothetical protein
MLWSKNFQNLQEFEQKAIFSQKMGENIFKTIICPWLL